MASNIIVIPHLSPRIIKILAPVTTISVQDLTNEIKDWEDEPSNLSYPILVRTAGKESLGGGVFVGITAELQNAKVMFEARTESDTIGTVTDSSNSSTILTDDNAAFTYLIFPGDTVINMVTGAVATILSIDSATQITHEPLDDGTTNTWSYGDDYKIWNKVQCEINGGNLVAVDTTGADISPFLPSAFTHVIRTSASSATLQEQEDIQFSAFDGAIHIDAINGTPGTTFPAGTPRQPVDNLADALTLSTLRGIDEIHIIGNFTFVSGDDISGKEIVGEDPSKSTLTFEATSVTALTQFKECTVQGIFVRPSGFTNCRIIDFTGSLGGTPSTGTVFLVNCILSGTIIVDTDLEGSFQLIDCTSGVEDHTFDLNGSAATLVVRNFTGDIEIKNVSSVYALAEIDMISGNVILDSSNTDGRITLRGISNLVDNSNGATIDTTGLIFAEQSQLAAFSEKITIDVLLGTSGTNFPQGTAQFSVNNLDDAISIANSRGISVISVIGNLTIDYNDDVSGLTIQGQTISLSTITLETGCTTQGTKFINLSLIGEVNGVIEAVDCELGESGTDLTNIGTAEDTIFNRCIIHNISLSSTSSGEFLMLDCKSGDPADIHPGHPEIDHNGSSAGIGIRNYTGGIHFKNITDQYTVHTVDMLSGFVHVDTSCTAGSLTIRGLALIENESTGITVNTQGVMAAWDQLLTDHRIPGSFGQRLTDILKLKRTQP